MTQEDVAEPVEQITAQVLEVFKRHGIRFSVVHSPGFLEAAFHSDLDLALVDDPLEQLRGALAELNMSHRFRVVQFLHYEIVAGYYAIVATRERFPRFFHFDCLYDPLGVNRYRFRSPFLAKEPDFAHGMPVVPQDRLAAYLVVKRAIKANITAEQWEMLSSLLRGQVDRVTEILETQIGVSARKSIHALSVATTSIEAQGTLEILRRQIQRARWVRFPLRSALGKALTAKRQLGRFLRPTGFFVVLVGPDGAGKSSVASGVRDLCRRAFRRTAHFHWRPGFLPQLRQAQAASGARISNSPPLDVSQRSRLLSAVRLAYYSADFILGYWARLMPMRARTTLIVGERYFGDILVHPQRYGFNVPHWLLRAIAAVIPNPDLTILLTNEAEVIHARKPELPLEVIKSQLERYSRELNRWGKHAIVDTKGTPEDVAAKVSDAILRNVSDRTLSRLRAEHG